MNMKIVYIRCFSLLFIIVDFSGRPDRNLIQIRQQTNQSKTERKVKQPKERTNIFNHSQFKSKKFYYQKKVHYNHHSFQCYGLVVVSLRKIKHLISFLFLCGFLFGIFFNVWSGLSDRWFICVSSDTDDWIWAVNERRHLLILLHFFFSSTDIRI